MCMNDEYYVMDSSLKKLIIISMNVHGNSKMVCANKI